MSVVAMGLQMREFGGLFLNQIADFTLRFVVERTYHF